MTIGSLASVAFELERLRAEQAAGKVVDTVELVRLSGELVRLSGAFLRGRKSLRLSARGKAAAQSGDGEPSLEDFIATYGDEDDKPRPRKKHKKRRPRQPTITRPISPAKFGQFVRIYGSSEHGDPLEHYLSGLNRFWGFPARANSDSKCGLVKEAGLHDATSFDRSSGTGYIGSRRRDVSAGRG